MLDFAPDFTRDVHIFQTEFQPEASVLHGLLALNKTVQNFLYKHITIGVAEVLLSAQQYQVPVLLSLKDVEQALLQLILILQAAEAFEIRMGLHDCLQLLFHDSEVPS